MAASDKHYKGRVVRLAELAGDEGVLKDFVFDDCVIRGPAVVFPVNCNFVSSRFGGDADAVLWEVTPPRTMVVGVIACETCTFENCQFDKVGFAGPPELISQFRQAVTG